MDPAGRPIDVEFVARDVPAFGWRRVRLEQSPPVEDRVDDGREIAAGSVGVSAQDDGTLTVRFGDRSYSGLGALQDAGDRGDTYDADILGDDALVREQVTVRRRMHPGGIQHLEVARTLRVPLRLNEDRESRSTQTTDLRIVLGARVVAGIERVDLRVRLDNTAEDHRLRLLFPTHAPSTECVAASTFDVVTRSLRKPQAVGWVHGAPDTFPHQGWVCVNDLTVVAPGLPEAEVWGDGTIALTLVRAVGWLSRADLRTRPGPAGPALQTPGAQCLQSIDASLSLFLGVDPAAARDAQIGLCAVAAGPDPLVAPGVDLIRMEPGLILLSALKPPETGEGVILRLFNPAEDAIQARVRLGFPVSEVTSVRLDETPLDGPCDLDGTDLRLEVPAKAIRSLLLR
jgi:alpha-mannosidase